MFIFFKSKIHHLIKDKQFFEIFQGSIWALGAQVLATCLAMITNIIVARVYGAEALGSVAIINSFLMFASIFTVLGTNTSIMRMIPEHVAKYSVSSAFNVYRKTQYLVISVSLIFSVLLFFYSELIANKIFVKPHLAPLFALASVFIVCKSLVDLNTQSVRGLRLIRVFAFMRILPTLSCLMFLLGSTYFFFNRFNPVYAILASLLITAVSGIWFMEKEFKKKVAVSDEIMTISFTNILSISVPMLMTTAMAFVIGQTGVILLGMYRSEAEVGYYIIAVKLAMLTTFVLHAINSMMAPKFSELYHYGNYSELICIARKSAKLIFWTSIPILLLLIIFGKYLLTVLFGKPFAVAYLPMSFIIVGQFINAISGSTGLFMNMTGHENQFRNIIAIATTINVTLNLILIPKFGIYGTAFAAMISLSFWNIVTLLFIKRKFGRSVGYFPFV